MGPVDRRVRRGRMALVGALAALAAVTGLAAVEVAPFDGWYYQFAWYSTLLALDAGLAWRTGRFPLFGRPRFALSLFLWSAPVWYFFEFLNLRLANWYYAGLTASLPLRWAGTFVAFATVLPALYLGHRWMAELGLAGRWTRPRFTVRAIHYGLLLAIGAACLLLPLLWPDVFYPLVWASLIFILEPWNHARDPAGSLLGDLSRGRWARIVRLLAGGLAIGLLWEFFNSFAAARWIYTVPGFENVKLFEMPVLGFVGFPVFALECFVIYRSLVNLGVAWPGWDGGDAAAAARRDAKPPAVPRGGRVLAAFAAGLVFAASVQAGIDRWTVDSLAGEPGALPGVTAEMADALRSAGAGGMRVLARQDSVDLARRTGLEPARTGAVIRSARLATLRRMGPENAAALWEAGIRSPCDLALSQVERVSPLVRTFRHRPHAGRPARVRMWLRAARDACPPREPGSAPDTAGPRGESLPDGAGARRVAEWSRGSGSTRDGRMADDG